jgi:hypothetical protein
MLTIKLEINGRQIAIAHAINEGQGSIGDYAVTATTDDNPFTGLDMTGHTFRIEDHPRFQSPWALVAKIAAGIAESENTAQLLQAYEQQR